MSNMRKNSGESRKMKLSAKGNVRVATVKSELMMEEIHKRATEIGPVLEGILHIHCDTNERWLN